MEPRLARRPRRPAPLALLDDRADHLTHDPGLPLPVPLRVYALYTSDEILAAFDQLLVPKHHRHQPGVLHDKPTDTDVLPITLERSEKHVSPTTRYADYQLRRPMPAEAPERGEVVAG